MKKGFTIVEILFLLVIIISFSIIIFDTEPTQESISSQTYHEKNVSKE